MIITTVALKERDSKMNLVIETELRRENRGIVVGKMIEAVVPVAVIAVRSIATVLVVVVAVATAIMNAVESFLRVQCEFR
jgi:hypothetical protein